MALVIFDLDGTLALTDHRNHLVRGPGPKDWEAFYAACPRDVPNWPVIDALARHVRSGDVVEIWTGRSAAVRAETDNWLLGVSISPRLLTRMRPVGDHRPDVELKAEWLRDSSRVGRAPDLSYEDRSRVVAMWRSSGVPCFQVAPGDF